jgi:hypothetical protein
MLVAEHQGARIEAAEAQRGLNYVCPKCRGIVIPKQGRKVIWHFAHKPPTDCIWATGETLAHLEAKKLVRDALVTRGLRAEMEYIVATLPGDRRADVMVWSPEEVPLAIELQHTSIGLDEIEKRAFSYAGAGIAQIWIPFLRTSALRDAEPRGAGCMFIESTLRVRSRNGCMDFAARMECGCMRPTARSSGMVSSRAIKFTSNSPVGLKQVASKERRGDIFDGRRGIEK